MRFQELALAVMATAASAASFPRAANGTVAASNGTVYTTEIVTAYTTYCPAATTIVQNSKTYTVTGATTLTKSIHAMDGACHVCVTCCAHVTPDPTVGALSHTMNQIWDGLEYFAFNDNPAKPSEYDMAVNGTIDDDEDPNAVTAHAKGVIAFSPTQGFWLTHSVPNFPLMPTQVTRRMTSCTFPHCHDGRSTSTRV